MPFILFIAFLALQRLLELFIASRNAKWMLQRGAVEYGREHYPVMVAMHSVFILSLITEYCIRTVTTFHISCMIAWLVLIALKVWVIASLGRYWNTRIYRIPGAQLVSKGPYKYFKHPNYIIVVAEIAIIPLVYGLWCTALVFTALNTAMLYVRIGIENKALSGTAS